jgi:hypothetical protein
VGAGCPAACVAVTGRARGRGQGAAGRVDASGRDEVGYRAIAAGWVQVRSSSSALTFLRALGATNATR